VDHSGIGANQAQLLGMPALGPPIPSNRGVPRSARHVTTDDLEGRVPVHVVWEITVACNLKCRHCGSRAGHRRANELSTQECLQVVEQLAELGTREVSLIGGEAYLRSDWIELIRAIRHHGMRCALQTGGRGLTNARLRLARDAGLQGVGVSIDGLEALHDETRGVPGSFRAASRYWTIRVSLACQLQSTHPSDRAPWQILTPLWTSLLTWE
jgi:sulfatase maturation enzyme AslB (radical SAM superfamily)